MLPNIIICGKMASGKTTIKDIIMSLYPEYKHMAFGQKVKDVAKDLFNMKYDDFEHFWNIIVHNGSEDIIDGESNKKYFTSKKELLISLDTDITFNEKALKYALNFFKINSEEDLYYRVGIGKIENTSLKKFAASNKNRLLNYFRKKISKKDNVISHSEKEIKNNFDQIVFTNEEESLDYTLAKCCNPIPGDNVFGFLTVQDGIKVHKKTCSNSISLQSKFAYRIVKAKWIDSTQEDFSSIIKISGIDNLGIVSEITRIISNNLNINMKKMSFDTFENTFAGTIKLQVKNKLNRKKPKVFKV